MENQRSTTAGIFGLTLAVFGVIVALIGMYPWYQISIWAVIAAGLGFVGVVFAGGAMLESDK